MSESLESIWNVLDLEPTSNEREIKRAYAKKLKQIRPEEDPVGFQNLREARDEALWEARMGFYDEEAEDEGAGETVAELKADAANDVDYTAEFRGAAMSRQVGNDDEEQTEDVLSPDHSSQQVLGNGSFILVQEQDGLLSPLEDVADRDEEVVLDEGFHLTSQEDIENELERFTGPWGAWDLSRWKDFIGLLRESPFEISRYAEYEVLQTLSAALSQVTDGSERQFVARDQVLTYLNQEFGWTQNDRQVYTTLGDKQAEELLFFIRGGQKPQSRINQRRYYDLGGFPLLSRDNFLTYLGREDSVYERYYHQCKANDGQYFRSWSWVSFVGGPVWFALRCNDGAEAISILLYVPALFFLYHGIAENQIVSFLIGAGTIVAIHLIAGFYGREILIRTMADVFSTTSEEELLEEQRVKKIKEVGQGGLKAVKDLLWGALCLGVIGWWLYRFIIG